MKNPWAKDVGRQEWPTFRPSLSVSTHLFVYLLTQSWKGKYSTRDPASWNNNVLAAEIGYNVELAAKHDDGVFWISWDDVLKVGHICGCRLLLVAVADHNVSLTTI